MFDDNFRVVGSGEGIPEWLSPSQQVGEQQTGVVEQSTHNCAKTSTRQVVPAREIDDADEACARIDVGAITWQRIGWNGSNN
jgi:hypothetical protein